MLVHFGLDRCAARWPSAVGCVGTFDGVHLGHRGVLKAAVDVSRAEGVPCVLATFDRHPAALLAPDRCPASLAGLNTNLDCIRETGVDVVVVLAFDEALSRMSAQEFLDEVLRGALRVDRMVVGHDFAFGRGREGTPDWLGARIATEVVPPLEIDGRRVSSSAIREAVAQGNVEGAARLLGRPFAIEGVVVRGQQLGRTLGYPTVNLARSGPQVQPADGVYAGGCDTPLGTFRAAISIGMRPAVGGTERTIEAFLLDYPGESLYGRAVTLQLVRRLRDETPFATVEALVEQIERDVRQVAQGD